MSLVIYNKKGDDIINELLSKEKLKDDDNRIRPMTLDSYTGQEKVKRNVDIFIKSSKLRGEVMDHILFYGPPGLGKTTLAGIIACELGATLKITTGPAIEKPGDLAAMLTSLNEGDVLFIDEIHRIGKNIEEVLYPAMEDFAIDILIGSGVSAQSIRLDLPKFTLIGATTRAGLISAPLRDRFGSVNRLELYSPEELAQIVKRDAGILGIEISGDAVKEIASRSRGTPRIAIRLLKRLMDFAVVENDSKIDKELAKHALIELDIDPNGLDRMDLRVLNSIHENFNDGPVGIETLAAFIGEDVLTIEDVCEPFLMQSGFLAKTPKGRILTEKGIKYAKKTGAL